MPQTLREYFDPEIQIIEVINCDFCSLNLDALTLAQRQEHYEVHLEGVADATNSVQPIAHSSYSTPITIDKSLSQKLSHDECNEKQTAIPEEAAGVFWHRRMSIPPPRNYTQGLIPLLKKALLNSHSQGSTLRAVLCGEQALHISTRTGFDAGWGCGYRNFQMACATLMDQEIQPQYSSLLSEPSLPGMRNLQKWIEDAWEAGKLFGFDPQGAQQLKNLAGTNKWIGTADLYAASTYRGIPAELVDIDLANRPKGADIVKDWIVNYFSPKSNHMKSASINDALRGASPIVITDRMPVILQNQGHSRTIVGYEITKANKIKLLMFDPALRIEPGIQKIAHALATQVTPTPTSGQKRSTVAIPPLNAKRSRLSTDNVIHINDGDEIDMFVRGPPTPQPPQGTSKLVTEDHSKPLLKFLDRARLHTRKLGKLQYQILYFPMTQPLSESDKLRRKTVTSTRY